MTVASSRPRKRPAMATQDKSLIQIVYIIDANVMVHEGTHGRGVLQDDNEGIF